MGNIDWDKVSSIDDALALGDDVLFDDSPEYVKESFINPNLTEAEREDALFWLQYARGLWLVTGDAGSGKGVFLHMIASKFRHYYGRLPILDTKPRMAFGKPYLPFNIDMLVEQLERMREVATGIPRKNPDGTESTFKPYKTEDGKWISSRGEMFLRNAVLGLDEFGSKYYSRRDPMNPIQVTFKQQIFPFWRHLRLLIIGCGTSLNDFNTSCFEKVTLHVVMTREHPVKLQFKIKIKPMKFISATGEMNVAGKPISMLLDAEKPRDMLGGLAWKDIFVSDNAQAMSVGKSLRKKAKEQ